MKSSEDSPRFRGSGWLEIGAAVLVLCLLELAAAYWFYRHDFLLYYGDAQAHLNISRRIFDSLTPGYEQLGSPWLPVPHLLSLPFVLNDWLWSTGLAGTIPVALCFVVAGAFFYLAAWEEFSNHLAATVVLACFALNPNLLYLASIPMTEVVFLAEIAVLLYLLLRFRRTQESWCVIVAAIVSWLCSLTRYDGWFLIPFVGAGFLFWAKERRWKSALYFGLVALVAPLYWFGHNYWEHGDPLEFYWGPYSAKAIQQGLPYPGKGDWYLAAKYYLVAGKLCTGAPILVLGGLGLIAAIWKKRFAAIGFLLLIPLFYIWSRHSSGGTPIHVPSLPPFSYYNTRYGIVMLPLAAMATGALVTLLPGRWRKLSLAFPLIAASVWLIYPSRENWICWKESEVNSVSRRDWTNQAADFLAANYGRGQKILSPFGDLTGIYCRAQIPLREVVHEGNGLLWETALARPDLFRWGKWAVAQSGDRLSQAIQRSEQKQHLFALVKRIEVKDARTVEIYRRVN